MKLKVSAGVRNQLQRGSRVEGSSQLRIYLNPPDPQSRSLKGVPVKYLLVVEGPKLGDLLSISSRGSGYLLFFRAPVNPMFGLIT